MVKYVESKTDFVNLCETLSGGSALFQFIFDEKIHPTKNKPIALFIGHLKQILLSYYHFLILTYCQYIIVPYEL